MHSFLIQNKDIKYFQHYLKDKFTYKVTHKNGWVEATVQIEDSFDLLKIYMAGTDQGWDECMNFGRSEIKHSNVYNEKRGIY